MSQIHKKQYVSYVLMLLSCILWVAGYIYSNQKNLNPIETSILRGFMIMIFSYIMCKYNSETIDVKVSMKQIMIRNGIFLAQAFIMAMVQFYLPLSVVHTIGSTGPLYVSVYEYFLSNKKITRNQLLGMIIVVFGMLLTVNGRSLSQFFDPSYKFESDFNYKTNSPSTILFYSCILIFFMMVWGYGVYITNRIQSSPSQVNFLFGAKLYLISSFLYPILVLNGQQVDKSVFYWGILFTGVLFAISEICFVCSIMLSQNIGMTIMLGSFTIIVAYFVGVFRYGEALNGFCLFGSLFMLGGLSKLIFGKN